MSETSVGRCIENMENRKSEEAVSQYLSVEQVRSYKHLFCFLNGKDRDILYLIFVSRKKQNEVRAILQRSQPSLCYDIKRIRRRLKFIKYINEVFDIFIDFIQNHSSAFLPEELDILTLMFYSSSFTQTADVLSISPVRVRYAFDKCVRRMEELEMWDVYEIFTVIRNNLNIIKRKYKGSDPMSEVFFPF